MGTAQPRLYMHTHNGVSALPHGAIIPGQREKDKKTRAWCLDWRFHPSRFVFKFCFLSRGDRTPAAAASCAKPFGPLGRALFQHCIGFKGFHHQNHHPPIPNIHRGGEAVVFFFSTTSRPARDDARNPKPTNAATTPSLYFRSVSPAARTTRRVPRGTPKHTLFNVPLRLCVIRALMRGGRVGGGGSFFFF